MYENLIKKRGVFLRPLKFCLKLKLSLLLFFVSVINIQANTDTQKTRISLKLKEVSIEQVLKKIESLSEFNFIYADEEINFKRIVSVNVKNERISKILEKLFIDANIAFSVGDKQIILKPKPIKIKEPITIKKIEQQVQKEIRGTVTDITGTPLPGVNIIIVGTGKGTDTDFDGNFIIKAQVGDVLKFSYIGMQTKKITVGKQLILNVKLEEDASKLDEVVVVAFGKQKKSSVIASITTIKPADLKVPSSNLTTALAGRVSGIISYQRSGEPGDDNAEFFVRGITTFGHSKSPLILLDGFEITSTELARIQPDDVASFSIMKDATATSLYGARGANGIILVTTKEGKEGKARISFRHETSISKSTRIPQVIDGIAYMKLYNQALFNDDPLLPNFYDVQRIENTKNNLNEFVYPNINWYDELFNDYTVNKRYNLSVTGGGKKVLYYLAASYSQDNGILNVDKKNDFNSNIKIDNYNVRSNLNIELSESTKIILKINSDFRRSNKPIPSGNQIFNSVMAVNPVDFPKFYAPDEANIHTEHILFGNIGNVDMVNPYAEMVKGYTDYFSSTILSQLVLEQDLGFVTEGLSFRGGVTIQSFGQFSSTRSYNPYYYIYENYDEVNNTYDLVNINTDGSEALGNPTVNQNSNSRNYFEGRLLYQRSFDKHDFSGLLVAMGEEKMNQGSNTNRYSTLPSRNNGISGRVTYGYDSRYLFEANFGYNGSEKFSEKERYGFFPSFGVGYIISNENYWKNFKKYISNLKVKFTYGLVGNDAIAGANDRFFFLSDINTSGNNYAWGANFQNANSGYTVNRYANPFITWEESEKFNLGFEMEIAEFLNLQVDFFHENRSNIYMKRDFIPSSVGMDADIYGNVGKAKSSGVDGSLDFNYNFSDDIWMSGRSTFTYATNEIVENENQFAYDYLDRRGHSVSQQWGLVAERLFVDQNEIDNSPTQSFGVYKPGDIKYKDINGDGVINVNDEVAIGYPTSPQIVYGFGLSSGYKNIDLSFFFQGSAKSSFFIDPGRIAPFVNRRNALKIVVDDYWSQNNPDPQAFWPRLSTAAGDNNTRRSTWWLRDGAFLRLKNVEVGYSLSKQMIEKLNVDRFRVYCNASNLLTISKFKLWDPEMGGNGLGYPVQRIINFGLQVNL